MLVEMQTGEAIVENGMEFPQKTKNGTPCHPAIPLLGLYLKNPGTPMQRILWITVFIAAQFTIAKYWKQPKCLSANESIKKLWYIYTMEFYGAEGKKELIPFVTAWMELGSIMLSEISQQIPYDLTYKWNLNNKTNKQAK